MTRGFSLIEVIVALFIATVASVIFFQIISSSLSGIYGTQKRGNQIYAAQKTIENKIATQYTTGPSTSITFTFTSSKSTTITIKGTIITDASKTFYIFVPAQ